MCLHYYFAFALSQVNQTLENQSLPRVVVHLRNWFWSQSCGKYPSTTTYLILLVMLGRALESPFIRLSRYIHFSRDRWYHSVHKCVRLFFQVNYRDMIYRRYSVGGRERETDMKKRTNGQKHNNKDYFYAFDNEHTLFISLSCIFLFPR